LVALTIDGLPLLFVTVAIVFTQVLAIPAENGLLAHFTPGKWRGTAYGAKFVLALGAAASAIPIIAWIHSATGGFTVLYLVLAGLAAVVGVAGLLLPSDRPKGVGARLQVAAEPAD
jgi:sugar phosphate permease